MWHVTENSCLTGTWVKRSKLARKSCFWEIFQERFIRFFLILCMMLDIKKYVLAVYLIENSCLAGTGVKRSKLA